MNYYDRAYDEAMKAVQELFSGKFVYCFGQTGSERFDCASEHVFDFAVYDSESDFDADAEDGDNIRVLRRPLATVTLNLDEDGAAVEVVANVR